MSKFVTIWTFSDSAGRLADVMAAARAVGAKVNTFVGSEGMAAQAYAEGADQVFNLDIQSNRLVEDYAASMVSMINAQAKPALVILPASIRGKAVAAKLGHLLNAGVVNEVASIDGDAFSHMVYGGLAFSKEEVKSDVAVITVGSGAFPVEGATPKTGSVMPVPFVEPAVKGIERVQVMPKQAMGAVLNKAKRVVGVGRGFAQQSELQMADELAKVMQAEVGCSRPIAEGEQWLPRERYIGVSGVMLKPEVYVAIGISGQVQHMVGVSSSNKIFAINKDKKAPIFKYVDVGIVGDLKTILPKLTELLK